MAQKRPSKSPTNPTQPTPPNTNTKIPPPFTPAPKSLTHLLTLLNKAKIYITHIDRTPIPQKQTIFLVPVLLNLSILLFLLYRAYTILPWYTRITAAIFAPKVDPSATSASTTLKHKIWLVFTRTLIIAFDYLLVTIVWPWPISFFLERPGNPCSWRWRLGGFRGSEVIVRVSRGWGAEELLEGNKKGGESAFWKTRIQPNIDEVTFGKSGYLLMGKDYDLDFAVMAEAQGLVAGDVKSKEQRESDEEGVSLAWRDLDRKILAFHRETMQWVICDIPYTPPPPSAYYSTPTPTSTPTSTTLQTAATPSSPPNDSTTYSSPIPPNLQDFPGTDSTRSQILKFRAHLITLNKESLFNRWIELIQSEARRPGFQESQEMQFELGLKVQALFEEEGVDWGAFSRQMGM